MIKDPFGRPVKNLRVAITQKCNLNCFYCHREGENYSGNTEMTPEEIQRIVKISASQGIKKVKLTGGEPLLRNDVVEIVRKIKSVHGITEVAMTTNGTCLSRLAKSLKEAGLTRINISLDTLQPETYRKVTRTKLFNNAIKGIKDAAKTGLTPVKINMVFLKGVNENQVWEMIRFTKENGLILQLIEFESANEEEFYKRYHSDLSPIENKLKSIASEVTVRNMQHRKKYLLFNSCEVEIVRPMHNTEFCRNCSRMRITSDGKFKPCLFRSDNLVDFLKPMRNNASNKDLTNLFVSAVSMRKPYFI